MASRRQERVSALLQQSIGTLLLRELRDPRLAGVIVTEVDTSPDLRHARIYYRVLGTRSDPARAQMALDRAAGYIQGVVGREVRLRYTPELRFVFDASPDRAQRVERLLAATGQEVPDDGEPKHDAHRRRSTR